jgi:1-acyl-sn-glycerol-3-phosphate acyltransferase
MEEVVKGSPIQIKSSNRHKEDFLLRQQRRPGPKVVVIVVNGSMKNNAIRRRLYGLLEDVRNRGFIYDEVWAQLNRRKRCRGVRRFAKEIEDNRKRYVDN